MSLPAEKVIAIFSRFSAGAGHTSTFYLLPLPLS
jgi:hypothetical protein